MKNTLLLSKTAQSIFLLMFALFINAPLCFAEHIAIGSVSASTGDSAYLLGRDSISIDPAIQVTGSSITNFKVSITTNFKAGDTLSFSGTLPTEVTASSYDSSTGILTFTGTASYDIWQALLRQVKFSTTSTDTSTRTISFTLGSAIPFSGNGHYYEYVAGPITWEDARVAATDSNLYGLQGYLATITSPEENEFIRQKLAADGWIGATDSTTEGEWFWVTGPEAGQQFTSGNYPDSNPVNSMYNHWNTNEPNNMSGENCAQIYSSGNATSSGKWNDYACTHYQSDLGYVVEYGGSSGDVTQAITATKNVSVSSEEDPLGIVSSPAYTKYNTYIGQSSFLELASVGTSAVRATVFLYKKDGTLQRRISNIVINPGTQRDISISQSVPTPDTYGLVRVVFNSSDLGVSLRGRVANYRLANSDDAQSNQYAFVFARELRSPITEASYARANTLNPSNTEVENFVEIANVTTATKQFRVKLYNESGTLLSSDLVAIAPKSEYDVPGGHQIGAARYLAEIVPVDTSAPYIASIARYGKVDNAYVFGAATEARKGTGFPLYIPISAASGTCWTQSNTLQLANTTATQTEARVKMYNKNGSLVKTLRYTLAAHQQKILSLDKVFTAGSTGLVAVVPSDAESIIAQNDTYFSDCNDNSTQSGQSTMGIRAGAAEQAASYNRYLEQGNVMLLSNVSDAQVSVTINVLGSTGQELSEVVKSIPAHGTITIDLRASAYKTQADTYGVVKITTTNPETILGQVFRRKVANSKTDFSYPTSVK